MLQLHILETPASIGNHDPEPDDWWRISRTAHAAFVLDTLEQALADCRPVQARWSVRCGIT